MYEQLFNETINFMEFSLEKYDDGYGLYDWQGANLGNIESDRFDSAEGVFQRMGTYINDYMLDDEEWGSYGSVEEALREKPDHPLREMMELIAYHAKEVDLGKAYAMR